MTARWTDFGLHIARVNIGLAGLALAAHEHSIAGTVVASIVLFLAAFALNHDVSHNALALPHGANELALAFAGSLMLMSGHAIRATHVRHHLRPLANDDFEGAAASMSLSRALLTAPMQVLATRRAGYRLARRRDRAWQRAETLVTLAIATGLLTTGSRPLAVFVVVTLGAQFTMPVWAAYIPHNAPECLVAIARKLSFTRSPTVLSLAYHDLHHANPKVPCRRLHEAFEHAARDATNRSSRACSH